MILVQSTNRSARKQRLDTLLTDRKLAASREQARRLILAGEVLINGESGFKPGQVVPEDVSIEIKQPMRYVGRGGLKLEKALKVFGFDACGKVALDVGASTGGFTDCLLQHGAQVVYAVDVGHGQLAWKLREDSRVRVMERTNARGIDSALFDLPIEIGVIDVSFISLRTVLPVVAKVMKSPSDLVALIKPQFEAGREQVGKGGVVRNPRIHVEVIQTLIQSVQKIERCTLGLTHSPIRGPAGNIEYLLWTQDNSQKVPVVSADLVERIVEQAHAEL